MSSSLSVVRDSTDWLPLVSHYWVKQTHATFYGVAFQVSSEAAHDDVVVCFMPPQPSRRPAGRRFFSLFACWPIKALFLYSAI